MHEEPCSFTILHICGIRSVGCPFFQEMLTLDLLQHSDHAFEMIIQLIHMKKGNVRGKEGGKKKKNSSPKYGFDHGEWKKERELY